MKYEQYRQINQDTFATFEVNWWVLFEFYTLP